MGLMELATLNANAGKLDEALEAASQALPLYKALDDVMGQAAANDMIGGVEDAKVVMEKEEEQRKEVPSLMAQLKRSLDNLNSEDFKQAWAQFSVHPSVTDEDVEKVFGPAMERDREGTTAFLEENEPEGEGSFRKFPATNPDMPKKFSKMLDRRLMYLIMRYGGMGYGPNLRQCRTVWSANPGKRKSAQGLATLKLKESHEDWEEFAGWHAGILDC